MYVLGFADQTISLVQTCTVLSATTKHLGTLCLERAQNMFNYRNANVLTQSFQNPLFKETYLI